MVKGLSQMHEFRLVPISDACIPRLDFLMVAGAILNFRREALSMEMRQVKLFVAASSGSLRSVDNVHEQRHL